jgi:Amt family ammonium transporter
LGNQALGLAFTAGLAVTGTFIILKVVGAVTELRVTPEDEASGLDLTEHGECAYND